MVRNWVAGALALGGLVVGALVGLHVPGLAANGRGAAAGPELADRISIEDMVTRYYGHSGRQGAAEAFGALRSDEAAIAANGIVAEGREAIEAFYAETTEEPDAAAAQGTFHMIISNPVTDVDSDTATASFFWTGVLNTAIQDPPQLLEHGREYDLLVRQDGQWRIKKRVVIADSGLPDRYMATYAPRPDYDISAEE